MERITRLIILITFSQLVMGQNSANKSIDLTDLEGKWFINQSNFPMWLKGYKTSPTFNYTIVKKKKGTFLMDRVEYVKNGKAKSINGIDKPLSASNTEFIWRGNGILRILKSKWKILYIDTKSQWAIIYFEKTLFTPEGYDIISRNKTLPADLARDVKIKLAEYGVTLKLTTIIHNEG